MASRTLPSPTYLNLFVRGRATCETVNCGRIGCACYVPIGDADYDMATDTNYFARTLLRAEPSAANRTVSFSTALTIAHPEYYEGMIKLVLNSGANGRLLTVNSLEGDFPPHTLAIGEMLTTVLSGGRWTVSETGEQIWAYDAGTNTVSLIPAGASVDTGDLTVSGKLTVTGIIDPTGVVLDEQAATPAPPTAGKGIVWVRNDAPNVLVFTDDAGTDHVLGAGTGDVVGPAGATDNAVALYDGVTGKLIQNSALTSATGADLTVPSVATLGGVAYPAAPGAVGQVLTMTGAATAGWQPNGDVTGPAGVTQYALTRFADATGNAIDTSVLPVVVTLSDAGVIAGLTGLSTAAFTLAGMTYPTAFGTLGQVLTYSGPGTVTWQNASGDVTGPAGATQYALARYSDVTGKNLDESLTTVTLSDAGHLSGLAQLDVAGVTYPTAAGVAGQVLALTGGGTTSTWSPALLGVGSSTDNALMRWDGTSGDTPQDSGVLLDDANNMTGVNTLNVASTATLGAVAYPVGAGIVGQVLTLTGPNTANWQPAGTLTGTGTAQNIARWSGASALDNSPANVSLDNAGSIAGVLNLTATGVATLGGTALPGATGAAGQVLTISAPGTAVWAVTGGVNGPGALPVNYMLTRFADLTGNNIDTSPATNVTLDNTSHLAGLNDVTTVIAHIGGVAYPNTTGIAGQVLGLTAPNTAAWVASGGDVTGPAGATQWSIARYADATGKLLDETAAVTKVLLNDAGDVTGVNNLTATGVATLGGTALPGATGAAGQALVLSAPGTAAWTTVGNVSGTSALFPNSIARWATANTLDEAPVPVTLSNAGDLAGVANLTATGTAVLGGVTYPVGGGVAGQVPVLTAPTTLAWGNALLSTGASTDTALVRWQGATGSAVQDSNVTLDGANNMTGIQNLTAVGVATLGGTALPGATGLAGQALVLSASGTAAWAAVGNVSGTSTTLNALTRWSGPATIDECPVTVTLSNAGDLAGLNSVTTTNATIGTVAYPSAPGTAGYVLTMGGGLTATWQPAGNLSGASTVVNALARWSGPSSLDEPTTVVPTLSNTGDIAGVATLGVTGIATLGGTALPGATGLAGEALVLSAPGTAAWTALPGGDVVGPASAVDNHLARFDGATGKLIQDGTNVALSDTDDLTGLATVNVSGVATLGGTAFPAVAGAAGEILVADGGGNAAWSSAYGDVAGPASSVDNHIALYDGVTGKLLKDASPIVVNVGAVTGVASIVVSGVATLGGTAFPAATGLASQILVADGGGNAAWTTPTYGDVTGPASSVDNHLATFHLASGKIIQDNSPVTLSDAGNMTGLTAIAVSGVATLGGTAYPAAAGLATQILVADGGGNAAWTTPSYGDVVGPASSTANHLALYADATGKLIKDSSPIVVSGGGISGATTLVVSGVANLGGTAFPSATGAASQILVADGGGNAAWTTPPYGDVSRNGATVNNRIARWHGTGATIQNSGVTINDSNDVTGVRGITASGGTVSLNQHTWPSSTGTNGYVLTTDGATPATLAWTDPATEYLWQTTTESTFSVLRPQGAGATNTLCFGAVTPYDTGTGSRMWFDATKAAFRAGSTSSSADWQLSNVGPYSVVLGANGRASAQASTVSGGIGNQASALASTISGGAASVATGDYTTVGGGANNQAGSGDYATVGGGRYNVASGDYSAVGGGGGGGGVGNTASGTFSAIAGGERNEATVTHATVAGGFTNRARGLYSAIGGGGENLIDQQYATIPGGRNNAVDAQYATIGGGQDNSNTGFRATIAGGYDNGVTAQYGAIGGGRGNAVQASDGTIGGGTGNTVSGARSVVAGGTTNTVSGDDSFACGDSVFCTHDHCFMFSDGSALASTAANRAHFRTTNGCRWYTAVGTATGVQLNASSTSWASISDRTLKQDIAEVDYEAILANVEGDVHVYTYRMKSQADDDLRFSVGTMAQEFAAVVDTGKGDTTIDRGDASGVNLALAIAIRRRQIANEDRVAALEKRNEELAAENAALKERLARIEAAIGL